MNTDEIAEAGRPGAIAAAKAAQPPPPTVTGTATAEPGRPEDPRPALTAYDVASIRSVVALYLHDADRLTGSMTRTVERIVNRRLGEVREFHSAWGDQDTDSLDVLDLWEQLCRLLGVQQ